ncbi:MAG: family intrarane metalloprotease [Segetibacter sp.]|jgi:membrane protease YdiL (CAAX protease family)|nr:family intrarane metalloprotease [Segetibacter sp.]
METIAKPLIKQGWLRALIYFVAVFLIVVASQTIVVLAIMQLTGSAEATNDSLLNFGLLYFSMAVAVFLFTLLMRKVVDRKSFKSLGFTWKGYSNEAGLGFFASVAMLGIGSLILVALGYLDFISASVDAGPLLLEIAIMVVVAFVEELSFRGYLLNNLMQSMNKWVALGISALLFAAFHGTNPDVTVFAIINIFLAGVLMGLNYIFTKNLWFSIFFHFAWNYFQGPLLGYEVSGLKLTSVLQQSLTGPELWTGGKFGFEGSLLCPLLLIVAILLFSYTFLKRYQPVVI